MTGAGRLPPKTGYDIQDAGRDGQLFADEISAPEVQRFASTDWG
jgi:hypothetical protein